MAAQYLCSHGLTIIEQNYSCRQGEIDLIARDGVYLVFAEVKYRASSRMGNPLEAVGYEKQDHIRQAAQYYLYSHRYGASTPCRFDVVAILKKEITWIQNAF